MENKNELTAPCGLDCFNCEIQGENLSGDFAQLIHEKLGVPKDQISCKGCWQQEGNHFHLPPDGCATLNCAKAKGVDLCCNCDDFPCAFLARTLPCCVRETLGYALIFLWAIFCPKAVLAAKLLAVENGNCRTVTSQP